MKSLGQPLFIEYQNTFQPFNKNQFRPCPTIT